MSPNKTVGILGGGQLARMLAIAAADLGFNTHIYCPDRDCPAAQVANKWCLGTMLIIKIWPICKKYRRSNL